MRLTICGAVFVAASAIPAMAWADGGGPNFGKSGQLAISWDQAIGTPYVVGGAAGATAAGGAGGAGVLLAPPGSWSMIDFQYASLSNNGGSGTQFGLAPAADYFIMDNISVGGQILFSLASYSPPQGPGVSATTFGIAPQVGYNLGLTDNISFWPKLFFQYANTGISNNVGSVSSAAIGIFAPFLYHPVQHFFVGIGPNFSAQVISSFSPGGGGASVDLAKATTFGITATFGGYFLGD
jgi:hypothetical protein